MFKHCLDSNSLKISSVVDMMEDGGDAKRKREEEEEEQRTSLGVRTALTDASHALALRNF